MVAAAATKHRKDRIVSIIEVSLPPPEHGTEHGTENRSSWSLSVLTSRFLSTPRRQLSPSSQLRPVCTFNQWDALSSVQMKLARQRPLEPTNCRKTGESLQLTGEWPDRRDSNKTNRTVRSYWSRHGSRRYRWAEVVGCGWRDILVADRKNAH